MPTLTTQQAKQICDQLDQLLKTLEDLANRVTTGSSVSAEDKDALDTLIGKLSDLVGACATTVALAAFDNSKDAFKKLIGITSKANAEAKRLAAQVSNISKICKIGAAFLNVFVKLGTGNVAGIWSAVTDLSSALS
jgi:hypothetical protein